MKVVALIATESVSGPGRQLAAVARALPTHGMDMELLVTVRHPPSAFVAFLGGEGVPYTIIPDRGPLDRRMPDLVREHLDRTGADILQTHGYKASAIGFVVRRSGGIPWIGFYHGATQKGVKDRAYQWLEQRLLLRADRIVVVSGRQLPLFSAAGDRTTVIDNAVIPLPAGSGEESLDLLAGLDRPLIGVIGRLSHEKGVDIFLRACSELAGRGRAFSAVIVGDGPEEKSLRILTAQLELERHVRFAGRIDSVAGIYPRLDLVVLPSRSEGLPNVLLEAMAADRPVVATAVGAVPEVLREPGAGVMVQPGDPVALADAVESALASGDGPTAARARHLTLQRYSLEARVQRHLALYHDSVAPARVGAV
jgi:glycosyltransferase involved in cell wall biosynthesis